MSENRHIAETEIEDHKSEGQEMQWPDDNPVNIGHEGDGLFPRNVVWDNIEPVNTAKVIDGMFSDALDDHCEALQDESDEVERMDYPDYDAEFFCDADNS